MNARFEETPMETGAWTPTAAFLRDTAQLTPLTTKGPGTRPEAAACMGRSRSLDLESRQTWKDEPQPQVPVTFGLPNLKPEPCAPST